MLPTENKVEDGGCEESREKGSNYKLFFSRNGKGIGGVLLAEKWWENVFDVIPVSDRILLVQMIIGRSVFVFVCVYGPQVGISNDNKTRFYQMLQYDITKVPASEQLIICDDLNGHTGAKPSGFDGVHGGQSIWTAKH